MSNDRLWDRLADLQVLFAPLTSSGSVSVFSRPTASQVIFGLGPQGVLGGLRNLRHETRSDFVFLNYFEIWDALRGGAEFHLQKAYMHFDVPRPDGTGGREIAALHCDPGLHPAAESYSYKRGPHIHVPLNDYDLHKSHISLCLQDTELVCSDFDCFCSIMSKLVRMLDHEFLRRIETAMSTP